MNYQNELYHFGIKGQKWGVRRYQNPDGTLTEAGKKHYGTPREQKKLAVLAAKGKDKAVKKSPQFAHAVNNLSDAGKRLSDADKKFNELANEFYRDKKQFNKYLDMDLDEGSADWYNRNMIRSGEKPLNRNSIRELIVSGKWEAGKESVFDRFTQDAYRGVNTTELARRISKASDDYGEAYGRLRQAVTQYTDIFLGDYGSISYSNAKRMARYGAAANFEHLLTNEVDRRPYTVR